jgi:tetratricopeptide (TPR) repeat protein
MRYRTVKSRAVVRPHLIFLFACLWFLPSSLYAQDPGDVAGKEILETFMRESWEMAKSRSKPVAEWHQAWIDRFVAFADAHPESRYASILLSHAVGNANSMKDRAQAHQLSGRISDMAAAPGLKAKWASEQAEILELSWLETKNETDRVNAIAHFERAVELWAEVGAAMRNDVPGRFQSVGAQVHGLYRKALLLKANPADLPQALAALEKAFSLADLFPDPVGRMAESGLTKEHLLAEAFYIACNLHNREAAARALEGLHLHARQTPPVYYVVDYAREFRRDGKERVFTPYLANWFREHSDTKDAVLALYYAADRLFLLEDRNAALLMYRALLADHRKALEELEGEAFRKGEAGVLGNVIYNLALCERDIGNANIAIGFFDEFIRRYPNDGRTPHVEALRKNTIGRASPWKRLAVLFILAAILMVVPCWAWRACCSASQNSAQLLRNSQS